MIRADTECFTTWIVIGSLSTLPTAQWSFCQPCTLVLCEKGDCVQKRIKNYIKLNFNFKYLIHIAANFLFLNHIKEILNAVIPVGADEQSVNKKKKLKP